MEQFVSIIVFSVPGILVYFWTLSFGMNPTVKHNSTELVAISALFWVPTVLMAVLTFDILYLFFDWIFRIVGINLSFLNVGLITDLSGIEKHGTNLFFVIVFFALSIFFSYFVALGWSKYSAKVDEQINKIRENRNLTKLSDSKTVWDAFFVKTNEKQVEGSQAVLVNKIENLDQPNDESLIGLIEKASRPFETERALVIVRSDELKEKHKEHNYAVDRTYVDLKTGIFVSELNLKKSANKKS